MTGTVSGTATIRERIRPAGQHPADKPRQGCPQPARTQKTSGRGQPRRQLVAPLRDTTWKVLALGGETVAPRQPGGRTIELQLSGQNLRPRTSWGTTTGEQEHNCRKNQALPMR